MLPLLIRLCFESFCMSLFSIHELQQQSIDDALSATRLLACYDSCVSISKCIHPVSVSMSRQCQGYLLSALGTMSVAGSLDDEMICHSSLQYKISQVRILSVVVESLTVARLAHPLGHPDILLFI
jgi:hypothetical protein